MDWGKDPAGATPITEEQREGLKPSWIATRAELNEAEADNILAGGEKWRRRRPTIDQILDDQAVRELHNDLFGDVWTWAGSYRARDLNIGIEFWNVSTAVADLAADAKYWFDTDASESVDGAAVRFHHRLVQIHPFLNGNGRHAREITNLMLVALGSEAFTWGGGGVVEACNARTEYIRALVAADHDDFAPLVSFVRS